MIKVEVSSELNYSLRSLLSYIEDLERDRKILRWLESASDEQLAECFKYREDHRYDDATLTDAALYMMEKSSPECEADQHEKSTI